MSNLSIETTIKSGMKVTAEGNFSPADHSVGQGPGIEDLEILWPSGAGIGFAIPPEDVCRIIGELLDHHRYLLETKGRDV